MPRAASHWTRTIACWNHLEPGYLHDLPRPSEIPRCRWPTRQGAERPLSRCSHGGPPPEPSFRGQGPPLQSVGDNKFFSSSDPHPETLFWHSFWHTTWKWRMAYFSWHSIWHSIWCWAEVQHPLSPGARGWGPAVPEEEEEEEEEDEEKATPIEFRDPHLAGGERPAGGF